MLGVIGDVVQDVVVWLDEPWRRATDTRSTIHLHRGGSAANVAAFAAPLVATRFIGCVGADPAGDALAAELAGCGVDVRLQRRGSTGTIVMLVEPDGERSMFPSRGASAALAPIAADWLAGLDILHVTAYSFAAEPTAGSVRAATRQHRAAGGRIAFDVSSTGLIETIGITRFRNLIEELAPDWLSANAEETALLGLDDGIATLPATTLVVARAGARPTRLLRGGHVLAEVAVPPVADVRDTTGAGDAFNAGFLAALCQADATRDDPATLVAACRAGHALARRTLAAAGATLGD